MSNLKWGWLALIAGLLLQVAHGDDRTPLETVKNDYRSFYAKERLLRLGIGFGLGAIAANTSMDQDFQEWYQDHVRGSGTDDFADAAKNLGEGKYLIPLSLLASGLGVIDEGSPIGAWGTHTLRSYLTGGPALLLMQRATGGSRPGERKDASHWRPFRDNNGVSGHAFIGAVPFLTVARMHPGGPVAWGAYLASAAAAWSRINDDAHFLSQAALGWYMAWESVDAVFDADEKPKAFSLAPLLLDDGYGVAARFTW
ncbi:MAG: hypothetical protein D6819_07630 [Gammaproteobacteria bacterium]|nr:MAG: hypothetical protein D6819_07630 [Gammaproteobacteria bacterium]